MEVTLQNNYMEKPVWVGELIVGLKWEKNARYIGRGENSHLGNPFTMRDGTELERTRVLRLYEVWFRNQIKQKNYLIIEELSDISDLLVSGQDVILGCYCKHRNNPKRCHGDIIKKVLSELTNKDLDTLPF